MDPLSSLGVAGNVIQFVDFGIKLVSRFNQIYSSADGALQENTELSAMATRLEIVANELARSSYSSDPELRNIALSCRDASNELLALLDSLRKQTNQHRKLSTVRITLRSVIKEGVIRDLDSKLQRLQQQLNTRLLALLHGSNGLLTTQIADIIDANQKFRLKMTVSLDKLIFELEKFQMLGQNVIYLPEIGQQICALAEQSKLAEKRRRILKSLRYDIMYDRFEDVDEAYGKTFQWVLNDQAFGFSEWLKSPCARTYWITGKPGSGKSTLMKYIHQQPRTRELLREWAGSHNLLIVNHFFWVSGDQMQRRQIGLLRSLLYQILREYPQLIASVCETRWKEDELMWDEPWSMRALSSCFKRLANDEALDAKICLFIDGLDEYDGDHRELIRLLRELMTSSKSHLFKLCVSSRPWNVFEAEYGGLNDKLSLHELTSNDILSYVDCNLHEDQYLCGMFTAEHHRSSELIHMITKKAQGVFLWVHYVVRLLLKTAVDCPTMSDLVRMVDDYPDELDPLFERILAAIPKAYHRDTARMIQICMESVSPPPLTVLSFAEKGIENENYALEKEITELTENDLKDIQRFEQRLKGRCMDFIEIHRSLSIRNSDDTPEVFLYQVEFFHRTVRDFLQMKKEWLNRWAGEKFDVHLTICRATLALFKTLTPSTLHYMEPNELISRGLYQFFASAHILETDRGLPIAVLLEQLDEALIRWNISHEGYHWHWSNVIRAGFQPSAESTRRNYDTSGSELLYIAAQTGLLLYVKEKVRPNLSRRSEAILQYVLVADTPLVGFAALNSGIIRHLLDCGANPNGRYNVQSAWCEFLLQCLEKEKLNYHCLESTSVETIELLLQYGADPDTVCYTSGTVGGCISVEEILRKVHPDKRRIMALLEKSRKKRAGRHLDVRVAERQGKGTAPPAWDPQNETLEQQSDVELRNDCIEPASEIVGLRGDRSERRGEGLQPRLEKPELRKVKKERRIWAFLKQIFT